MSQTPFNSPSEAEASRMIQPPPPGRGGVVAVGSVVILLGLLLAASLGYALAFYPKHRRVAVRAATRYDMAPMRRAMSAKAVDQAVRSVLDLGPRYVGRPGFKAAGQRIRQRFAEAGLKVLEVPDPIVAPVTHRRSILSAAGKPLDGVEVWPLLPNQYQPMTTPEGGLHGRLVRVTDRLLGSTKRFDGEIALVDAASPPSLLGLDWSAYARMGFEAIIVTHHDGLGAMEWSDDSVGGMIDPVPINFVRLAASPAILDHAGQRVTLKVKTTYRPVPAPTITGLLRGGKAARGTGGNRGLLIVPVNYDAVSYLPDRSPGVVQALNLALQQQAVKPLAAARKDLRRDVLFVATGGRAVAQEGLMHLLGTLGADGDAKSALTLIRDHEHEHKRKLSRLRAIASALQDPRALVKPKATAKAMAALSPPQAQALKDMVGFVINQRLIEINEPLIKANLAFIRTGEDTSTKAFDHYREVKDKYEQVLGVAGYQPAALARQLQDQKGLAPLLPLRQRVMKRVARLEAYHRGGLQRNRAQVKLNRLVAGYDSLMVLGPHLAPAPPDKAGKGESVSFSLGDDAGKASKWERRLGLTFNGLMRRAVADQHASAAEGAGVGYLPMSRSHASNMTSAHGTIPTGAGLWNLYGYPAMVVANTGRFEGYRTMASPASAWDDRAMASVEGSAQVFGDALLAAAYGAGRPEKTREVPLRDFHGTVYAAAVGGSTIPSHPLGEALVAEAPTPGASHGFQKAGHIRVPMTWANPYGVYRFNHVQEYLVNTDSMGPHGWTPIAVRYLKGGRIGYISNEGQSGQAVYGSRGLSSNATAPVANLVTFRAAPMAVVDMVNPQTYEVFTSMQLVDRKGLAPLRSGALFPESQGSYDLSVAFAPPTERVFALFNAGSPENKLVQSIRAFMLNVLGKRSELATREREHVISGPGFLVADHPMVGRIPDRIAASMGWVNKRRLQVQQRYGMSDQRTATFEKRSQKLLGQAQQPGQTELDSRFKAQDAAVYQILNHPVLRGSIREAVLSILWYLALLVPFAFFFEKLAFGYTDVRKQLITAGVIFLLAFALLRVLHPAFQMVQSSLMILLGFIIMLISLGVLVMLSGRFGENLEELRQSRGMVSGAEVNTFGVMGTAFMLGLNNMHRRKVRTGLTCATLVLITFAMISFTSVQNNLVNSQLALGKAAYQGLLIKNNDLSPISDAQVKAITAKYGRRFNVTTRQMVVGEQTRENELLTPDLTLTNPGRSSQVDLGSMLVFDRGEPLAKSLHYLTDHKWFGKEAPAGAPAPIILPKSLAQRLEVSPARVDRGGVVVRLNGRRYRVTSIVTDQSLARVRGLDNNDVLPFDIESMQQIRKLTNGAVLATEPYARVQPGDLALTTDISGLPLGGGKLRTVSISIQLVDAAGKNLPYKQAHEEVEKYLEQSGQPTYYGLDQIAYLGERSRQASLSGLVDMAIPLLIAALTVLNTMRGSVYERRDEIYVYNAVGIAPKFVFFMFFAEALVYSVVGSVLGYLLSQGTGRVLTDLGWTGGLNMTFASMATVYASLAITAAVFLSTLFPALSAMRIAAPAEDAGWSLPEASEDQMVMQLPFTFDRRDRLAVLEFLMRIFEDHGEGAGGPFFASPPTLGVRPGGGPGGGDGVGDVGGEAEGEAMPELEVTVWLKPLDLGVSQRLDITMPPDADSDGYIAELTLTRLSGTRDSWLRLNKSMLARLRRHFLHWRAVSEPQRASMFDSVRERMREAVLDREEGARVG